MTQTFCSTEIWYSSQKPNLSLLAKALLKKEHNKLKKNLHKKLKIKYYIIHKSFCLKICFLMFLANFIFVVSHLKIHQVVHLNTLKALTSLQSKRKVYSSLLAFFIQISNTVIILINALALFSTPSN